MFNKNLVSKSYLERYSTIFWDFDGVIKDSLDVKSDCFAELFASFGESVQRQIREHHSKHGGLSRFQKIPHYLYLAGIEPDAVTTKKYCDRFSKLVMQRVISCEWVPGVQSYLTENQQNQDFILVTATPQAEIETILDNLKIRNFFQEIFGSPKSKASAINNVLKESRLPVSTALMIGDSETDLQAAKINAIDFVLRKTKHNAGLQKKFDGPQMKDFFDG